MTPKQREELYWQSPITNRINLNDDGEFIEFTAHFKYLGSYISFDLTDDMDIKNRITKANQAMGALRHFWRNPYADLKAKKLIFLAIPANLLLWGCETWALRQSHIDIRNILGIRIQEVIDDHITNERVRRIFHDIPDAEALLTARSMSFLGKTIRAPNTHTPKPFITAWIRNARPKSGVLTTNKKALVRSINTLLPEETLETITRKNRSTGESTTHQRHNPDGKISNWIHIALNKPLWEWHIYKISHPNSPLPPRPSNTPPRQHNTNQTQAEDNHDNRNNENNNQQDRERPQNNRRRTTAPPPPPPPPNPSHNHTRRDYNINNVGHTKTDSLKALGLKNNATDTEIKHQFRRLSLIYHPDKYSNALELTALEATAHFQLLNNAYQFLRQNRD